MTTPATRRVSVDDRLFMLDMIDQATGQGWTLRRACDVLEVDVRRV